MRIERYNEARHQRWEDFIASSLNGTIMHTRTFLSYHPNGRFIDHSLLIWDERSKLAAVLPAAEIEHGGQRVLQSHPGATYGGLVLERDSNLERNQAIVSAVVDYAAASCFSAIRMRTSERVYLQRHCEEIDAAYFRAGFVLEGRELSCAVHCSGRSAEQLLAAYKVNARNAIHKSRREGVSARRTDAFADFWAILETNLHGSHGVRPTHTLEEILRLRALLGPDRLFLVGGFHQDTLISGSVVFVMNSRAAHTMYMAQNYAHQQLRSLNLVLHTVLSDCADRGLHYVNFGISSVPGTLGREMNYGLDAFKRSFQGEGVLRDLWYKSL